MVPDRSKHLIGSVFTELPRVDSTNNYAIAKVHEGVAFHGDVFFAHEQLAGKGQFGKRWDAARGQNIMMSLVLEPGFLPLAQQFAIHACIAGACATWLSENSHAEFRIKWPNDLYWKNRKAGGILIENVLQGEQWKFAVAGIGININQDEFPTHLPNPVSLKQVTGRSYAVVPLAKKLCAAVEEKYERLRQGDFTGLLDEYNRLLYKRNQPARLKKGNVVFQTTILEVTADGRLHTRDVMDRYFTVGEVTLQADV